MSDYSDLMTINIGLRFDRHKEDIVMWMHRNDDEEENYFYIWV